MKNNAEGKNLIVILGLFFISFFGITGCSQKEELVVNTNGSKGQDFVFQILRYNKTGKSTLKNPEVFYYPPQLDKFFMRHIFEYNKEMPTCLYLIEKYYADCRGVLDTEIVYSTATDDGLWLEDLFFYLEEERLGNELENLENLGNEGFSEPIDFEKERLEAEK
ncbi:MAG: hypothetical protein MJ188_09715, partial [Treponema sp.]|nr:hypothetical protein [Treponema sp.]